ncbi:MAG TPA: TraB/GumN family protein [Vicinamibacterales bacterium]|nr:TraB/GumN family protein [Vicinamibacterales bacterium]
MATNNKWAVRLPRIAVVLAALTFCTISAAQTAATGKSFLWKVHAGSKVLYLAGSVHALGADSYPLSAAYENAFKAAGTLVEEINLADAEQLAAAPLLLAKGLYTDGRTFDSAVAKDTATMVATRLKNTGIPMEMIRTMKPWMVMLMLTAFEAQKAGLDAALGVDKYFFDKARAAGTPVLALETAESQIDRFDKMPESLQEQMLRSTLSELDAQRNSVAAMIEAWRSGNAAALEKMALSSFDGYRGAYTSLIVERNNNWVPQIEACMARSQPCFVVVGAAHLIGPDGLLTLLKKKGYQIEQQ